MVGTPTTLVSFSASIRSMASPTSHLRISTILRPAISDIMKIACEPVQWKSGKQSRMPGSPSTI